jgi:hypothetical protein
MKSTATPGWWNLVAAGEPFRLLFPLGLAIGIAGVAMWPLYIWNLTGSYPGQFHARIMIEGFLTAFVVGFLGTALPRLLDVPRLTALETLAFAAAVVGITVLQLRGDMLDGDILFVLTLGGLLGALGLRALFFRRDVPPPGFVLVIAGLISALVGASSQVVMHISPTLLPPWAAALGRLLLYQGYLVFPIMGIGAFLLPRFFGLPSRQNFPESLSLPEGWLPRAGFALLCGGVVMAGFVMEAMGQARWGNALRAAGIFVYFFREVPVHQAGFGGGSLALGLRLALFSIPLAYVLMAVSPERTSTYLHLLFISGFSLLTLVVASRVILGHSGQTERLRQSIRPVLVMVSLVVLAMLTRVSADFLPDVRMSHYAYAGVCWIVGVAVWACFILPAVRQPDSP